jgi:hypothetical protein
VEDKASVTGADRRNVPIAVLGTVMFACACVIGIAAEVDALPEAQSVRAAPARLQFNLTPQPTPAGGTDATATPTPRRIVIPTATADVAPTATQPVATSTPQSVIVVETAAPNPTSSPTPTLTPSPVPTATATPVPTATPTPAPAVAPTLAPVQTLRLDFTAADWRGGYFRGDAQWYGRPWVAVYGAQSDYPSATLVFSLNATPGRSAVLRLTGLDDELGALNPVALDVNGQRIYEGPSPFLNWDGQGTGANAAWTTAEFTIPSGALWSGSNDITFANLSPSANFNAPPYVLLADATLEIPGGAVAPTRPPIVPVSPSSTFAAEDWRGGFYRGDSVFYGRPWTAIYGAASDYPQATLRFRLSNTPTGPATLTVAGLDDELAGSNPMAIIVNGETLFEGPSPFQSWDGVGNGANAAWTNADITIPATALGAGRNDITIANLSPSATFGAPPYILLGDATLAVPGAEVTVRGE